jgi:hypothetical protein
MLEGRIPRVFTSGPLSRTVQGCPRDRSSRHQHPPYPPRIRVHEDARRGLPQLRLRGEAQVERPRDAQGAPGMRVPPRSRGKLREVLCALDGARGPSTKVLGGREEGALVAVAAGVGEDQVVDAVVGVARPGEEVVDAGGGGEGGVAVEAARLRNEQLRHRGHGHGAV